MMQTPNPSLSSFRDVSGHVFLKEGIIYRTVNNVYKENYNLFMQSGLYEDLAKEKLIIPHNEVDFKSTDYPNVYKLIQPDEIKFISYPYEWSFNQLKDAALLMIKIQKIALKAGMILKDANAFNIQWYNGKPILIDTLSFEKYIENKPWVAYKQYCQHFIAPLALMSYCDLRSNLLLKNHIDGIPLEMAKAFLPLRSKTNTYLLLHIHLHATAIIKRKKLAVSKSKKFTKLALNGLIDSLENTIKSIRFKNKTSVWNKYYDKTILSKEYLDHKKILVNEFFSSTGCIYTWDLGANTGLFSRIIAQHGSFVVSFDNDALTVEENYTITKVNKETNILPLFLDLNNPTPAIGWNNEERFSIFERPKPDCVLALALVHHLAISNNVPFLKLAKFFNNLSQWLLIEFIPKEDPKVQELLAYRQDLFDNYTVEKFEEIFCTFFKILKKSTINGSERILYLMQKIE